MTTIGEIYKTIDTFAPFDTQMDFDNSGLLVGAPSDPVTGVLVALDVTNAVVEEAREKGCNLIVSHHPVIFHPLGRIASDDVVYRLIANGIGVISAHTNFDVAAFGINTALADAMGLKNQRPLKSYRTENAYKLVVYAPCDNAKALIAAMAGAGAGELGHYRECAFYSEGTGQFRPVQGAHPAVGSIGALETVKETRVEMLCTQEKLSAVVEAMKCAHPYEQPAYDILETLAVQTALAEGLIGELEEPIAPQVLAERVKTALHCRQVKFSQGSHAVATLAVCGGAGSGLLYDAAHKADAYLTSEIKHHEWLAAKEMGLTIIDAGHFSTENIAMEPLAKKLSESFPKLKSTLSAIHSDPAEYL